MESAFSRSVARTLSLVLLGSLLAPGDTLAQQQSAGVVTGIQGEAQLTRAAAKPTPLRFKDGVVIRDVIDTREKSLARILFGGRSTVTVRELSRLEVREELLPGGVKRDVHDLSSGAILVHVARQLMKPGDEVQIRTPNAIAAIRGSTLFGQYIPPSAQAPQGQSFFAFLSGSGTVTPQGLPPVAVTANTPSNGLTVSGAGPSVQVNVTTLSPAQAAQILQAAQVGKTFTAEANKQVIAQASVQEIAQVMNVLMEQFAKTTASGEPPAGATTVSEPQTLITVVTEEAVGESDVEVVGETKTLQGSETLKTFSGQTTAKQGENTPVVRIADDGKNPATSSNVSRSGGTGSLILVDSGADVQLKIRGLLSIQNSTVTGSQILDVKGAISTTADNRPFIKIDPSTVSAPGNFISIGSGGSVTIPHTFLSDDKGTLSSEGDFFSVTGGGKVTASGTTTQPQFFDFLNTKLTVGTNGAETHFFKVSGSGSEVNLKSPLVVAQASSTLEIKGSAGLEIFDGGKLTSTSTSPFIDLTGGSLTFGSNVLGASLSSGTLDVKGSLFKANSTTITPGSGVPFIKLLSSSTLSAGGSLMDLNGVNLDLGTQPLSRIEGGSTLKNTAGPVIKISGGSLKADALAISDGAANKFQLTGTLLDLSNSANVTLRTLGEDPTSSTDTTTFTLAANEPWIKIANSSLKLTGTDENVLIELDADEFGSTFNGLALVATDSPQIILPDGLMDMEGVYSSTSTQPLVQLTSSTLENTDDLIAVEPGSVTDITLAGQLLKATGSTMKVFNKDKNTVQTNIALSAQPIDSIAVISDRSSSGDLNRAYVPIPGSNQVKVINTDNNTVVATITVETNPVTVGATKDGDRVLVLNNKGSSTDGTVSIINTHTNQVVATLTVGKQPEEVGFSAHDDRAYVINQGSDNVTVIDLTNNTVIGDPIAVGTTPVGGAVSQTGGNAYVTNSGSNNVSVINTDTGAVTTTITVGTKPVDAVLSPDEKKLYVINETSNNVSVIDTTSNSVMTTIAVGSTPHTGAIKPDGAKFYVVNKAAGTVSVIDTSNNTVTKTITVGTTPHDIAISRDGRRAYVANEGSGSVSVIDTSNDTVVATINVGSSPSALAVTPNGLQLFVVNEGSNTVSAINTVERGDFLDISGGAKLTANSTSPLLEFSSGTGPSTVNVAGTLVRVSGTGTVLTLASPLVKGTDTDFTIDRGFLRVEDGGELKSTSASALIQLTGSAPNQSKVTTTYPFARVEGSGAKLTLDGPFLSGTKTDFTIGTELDPANFLFFLEGAKVKSTSANPFVTFDNSSLKRAQRFLSLRRQDGGSVVASLDLAGPLLEAKTGSTFTTDRDFISVSEKATLTGTGTGALLQFTGSSTVTTTGDLGNADFFRVDDSTGESAQGPASVELAGGLVTDTGGTFTIADRFLNVRDGATLKSTSANPLIQLSSTTLSTERDFVQIDGTNSKIELSGSLLSAGSTLNIGKEADVSASLLNIHSGGQLVMNSTSNPVILFTGGTHTIGTGDSTSNNTPNRLVRLQGVNTSSTTGLGTDQPIKGPTSSSLSGATNPIGTLVKATDAATIEVKKGSGDSSGGNGVVIDTALYEATAPILDLLEPSTRTTPTLKTADATVDIFKSKVVANGPLVAMDKSFINVTNGAFIHVRGGSFVDITGDLLKLINGAKIEVINGPLIKVEGTSSTGTVSELKVSGALVNFNGTGNNKIIVNNSICSGACSTISGIQVKEGSTGSISIGSNPIKNSSLGSIDVQSSSTAVIQTGSSGKVNITAP